MRLSTLFGGIFGIALVAAAPIEEGKTTDLTTSTEGCGTVTLDTGLGYGLLNDRKCYPHHERITFAMIKAGYTCTFFTAPESCDQSKGYSGWSGPTSVNLRKNNRIFHGHKCWNTPQDAVAIDSPEEIIATRTPTEVAITDMETHFNEASVAAKGCGIAMLDDGTGVGYNMVAGFCYKSAPITKYWINQGCTCFFYAIPCDMKNPWTAFQGRTSGTVAGQGMRGYSCLDRPLDSAAASAIEASTIHARTESRVVESPNDKVTDLELSSNDNPFTDFQSAAVKGPQCGMMTITNHNEQKIYMYAQLNQCQNLHSLRITDYDIDAKCTCSFFISGTCDWPSLWFRKSGPSSGSLQGAQVNAFKCTL